MESNNLDNAMNMVRSDLARIKEKIVKLGPDFIQFKSVILKRSKAVNACSKEYDRAYKSESYEELMQVLKDNFNFAVTMKVIDPPLIDEYREHFNANQIFCNVDTTVGFLLASGNATVRVSGNATVRASGNATVEAWDNATVRASDNATVRASGNATVRARDNATVRARDNATVEAWDNATVRASDNATVEAWDNATVRASDNATVEAWGNAYITSQCTIECKLRDNAIYRIRERNIVRYAPNEIKFEKVDEYNNSCSN